MAVHEADTALRSGARSARLMHHPTLSSSTMPLEGRRVVGTAGPCCGGLGIAGYPCVPVLGGEGRPRSGRPQVPLEFVEKLLTATS
jgi:hypothetical protein